MVLCLMFSLVLLGLVDTVISIPKPDEKIQHFQHEKLHENHNPKYDHEQFLGEDIAKNFDELEPEESARRLALIADKIDEDKDGWITTSELRAWIQYTQSVYINEDVRRSWLQHNSENNETIAWEEYKNNVYGFMNDMTEEELVKEDNGITYSSMLNRDKRRWETADQNKDNLLSFEEFTAFLHPEDHPVMKDVVLIETIEDIDKDKDGRISLQEYIGDVYKADSDDEEEPEWVQREKLVFKDFRDDNKDGFLDRDEMRNWIQPKDFDHAEAEAKHLIFEADEDRDGKLTKKEIVDKYDLFVGSQATDFGEALARHDEF